MRPMLATPGDLRTGPPAGPAWVHEIKWDGIRLLADAADSRLRLLTRSGRDIAVALPELHGLAQVCDDVLLDGEAVAMVAGRPSFSHVVDRVHTASAVAASRLARTRPVTYMVFDLLRLDGMDLTGLPWSARRAALEDLLEGVPGVQPSPVFDDGRQLLAATADQRLEGVVSKRRASPYRAGVRSTDWLKFPHRGRVSVVIGGWRPQTGTVGRLGAVHVGVPVDDGAGRPLRDDTGALRLDYRGRVGAGLAGRAGEQLQALLVGAPTAPYPFTADIPRPEAAGSTWLEPQVVIDVATLEVTSDGRLRQPSYQGVRTDLTPEDLLEQT
ncbi:ATP-dependent DNA ligase [Ornithinimicrobium avium]|uniref:DNA ligase (ATP) n=1 Tax=Ornithinimicrobium avium TaxID=2283195 RepID=A0A345NQ78_9MICO|nr:DNA ligase [Ornithinimicrobium avium]AXH97186.1 DNA ligase [Ornithinimicrobium avium]